MISFGSIVRLILVFKKAGSFINPLREIVKKKQNTRHKQGEN